MIKFKFKLDSLIKILKIKEERKFAHFSLIAAEISRGNFQIEEMENVMHNDILEQKEQFRQKEFNIADVRKYSQNQKLMKKQISFAQNKINKLQPEFDKRRIAANSVRKERRTIEIYREKQYANFQKELLNEEAKTMDEFNIFKKDRERRGII